MNWIIEQSEIGRIVVPPSLPERLGLFYTTVDFEGRLNESVANQLMRLVHQRFGIEATLSSCTQIHGKKAVNATAGERWQECDSCDALWSASKGAAIAIKIADCLPVSIADSKNRVIANIHSGWRGAAQRIVAETLDVIERETEFDAATAQAWLGPTIRACCFEVGEEVVDQLRAAYSDAESFVDRSCAKPHVDVAGLTAALLIQRGFAPENVHDSGLCTRCDDSIFHSYRRDPKRGGRNLALIAR
ncbi:MAG TPA: polyphenol oxidase family protein [Thermoanaerobaculia bacterium]|nr:polyphenol oxidase family protein [Thermoanaerobaculia bacterium]